MIEVYEVSNRQQLEDAFRIRFEVFVEEQNVPEEEEIDEFEEEAIHFVVYDGERPIGASRLRFEEEYAKAERVCIYASFRGTGSGRLLMQAMEYKALEMEKPVMKLNAQKYASGFYQSLGYEVTSGEFMDAGIPHVEMKKSISW